MAMLHHLPNRSGKHAPKKNVLAQVVLLVVAAALTVTSAVAPARAQPDSSVDDRLANAVGQLGAATFSERSEAMQELLDEGEAAIPSLVSALDEGDTQSRMRVIGVLGQLAVNSNEMTRTAAEIALEKLTRSADKEISRLADRTFQHLGERIRQRALERLRAAGVQITREEGRGDRESIELVIGDDWHGDLADLEPMRRLNQLNTLVLAGPKINDELIDWISDFPKLHTLTVSRAGITNDSIAALARLPALKNLRIMYCDIDDQCLEDLLGFATGPGKSRLREIRFFGTGLSKESADTFAQATGSRIELRKGAFLGIFFNPGPNACTIIRVIVDSAADRAKIVPGDVITSCAGRTIGGADDFLGVLDPFSPGDIIPLTIEREGDTKELKVELGRYPDVQD